jgi:ribosomal protein S18 acetylase RimI-like enzyme
MQILRAQKLNPSELEQVVNLHYKVLDESFLNNFGKNFLRIAYRTNVSSKNNIVILVKKNDEVIGYLVATIDGDKFNQEIINKNFLALSWEIFKASLTNPKLALKVIKWKFKPPHENKIKPELQFIAIDPNNQGKGLGTKMLKMLNQEFRSQGIKQYRVGTKAQNKLSNAFYQKLGFKPFYQVELFGDRFNYYLSPK